VVQGHGRHGGQRGGVQVAVGAGVAVPQGGHARRVDPLLLLTPGRKCVS
jgi:hypothetical protein